MGELDPFADIIMNDEWPTTYWTPGHVSKSGMRKAALELCRECGDGDETMRHIGPARHIWATYEDVNGWWHDIVEVDKDTPGAKPLTTVQAGDWAAS